MADPTTDPWAQRLTAAASLVSALGVIVLAFLSWLHGNTLNSVDDKADRAAKEAVKAVAQSTEIKQAVEDSHNKEVAKIDEVGRTSAIGTAITAQWRAEHTGDPEDMAKAAAAEQALGKQEPKPLPDVTKKSN